jgi:hypothetical protein
MDSRGNGNEIAIEDRPWPPLTLFVAKAATAGVVAIVASWVISGIIVGAIGELLDQRIFMIERRINAVLPSKVGGTGVWAVVERELARAADPKFDLPPQSKQRIIADLRTVSDRWRPFFIEASSALIGSSPSPAKRE